MMIISAQAPSSSARRRFAAASAAKKVGLCLTARHSAAKANGSTPQDCTQIRSSASITTLCASTCACKRCRSLPIASAFPVNLPDFIVHGAMTLPMVKPAFCLEGHFLRTLEAFQ
jgi:hypothetical protein